MTRLCERPGCSVPAEVAYGFDVEHRAVWLDHLSSPGASRAGALCRRHADAMGVPIGWSLDDRREMAPRLFPARRRRGTESDGEATGAVATGGGAHAPTRREGRRRRSRASDDDTGQLAFDALGAAEGPTDVDTDPAPADQVPADAVSADLVSADLVPDEDAGAAVVSGASEGEVVDPTSPMDRPATPWQPVFDQESDLDGLLSARGSLLSRAFRGTPRAGD